MYNLPRTVESRIEYSLDTAMNYGDMPPGMLESKFEETDIGPDESDYDNYARNTLTDWSADTNRMEHEEARRPTAGGGVLQLRYYGNRGNVGYDEVYRPEYFDGFMGAEDRDPRGINVDPDMRQMTRQAEARTRFIRFTPDHCDQITGGGRSEAKVMQDQQTLFRTVRSRLKVFDRQLDGRRTGLRREYDHASNAGKQIVVQSYGDKITDRALNPTRRANIICDSIVNSRRFRDETADTLFEIAKYSQVRRRANKTDPKAARKGGADGKFAESSGSNQYRACGLLMADIVKIKHAAHADVDFAASKSTIAAKSAPLCKDLGIILGAISQDAEFQSSMRTLTGKTAAPLTRAHLVRTTIYNHLTPAHHLINAEIIYKSVAKNADMRKVADKIITDSTRAESDVTTIITAAKTAKRKMINGAKLNTTEDADAPDMIKTVNYKTTLKHVNKTRVGKNAYDTEGGKSDPTQDRSVNHTAPRAATTEDYETNMNYGDNAKIERHGRGLGKKYLNRFIDRDSSANEMSDLQ